MKLSVKSDYAARAVLALARYYPDGGARRVEELALAEGIPASYLVQILLQLKAKRMVNSQRGKEGGYLLARPPAQISLGEVIRCVHGELFDSPALHNPRCPAELRLAWQKLQSTLDNAAQAITFQDLLDQSGDKSRMYYI